MPEFSVRKFAELAGRGEATIHRAIKKGEIVRNDAGMIDTDAPKNVKYLDKLAQGSSKRGAKSQGRTKDDNPIRKRMHEAKDLETQKLENEIAYKKEQTLLARQKRARELGLLIERDIPKSEIADLAGRIKLHVLPIGKRTSKRITEMVQAGKNAKDVEIYMNGEIEKALQKVLDGSE